MATVRHHAGSGRRLHEESIRLQQRLSQVPLPQDPREHRHPFARALAAVLTAVVLVSLAVVLLPSGGVR